MGTLSVTRSSEQPVCILPIHRTFLKPGTPSSMCEVASCHPTVRGRSGLSRATQPDLYPQLTRACLTSAPPHPQSWGWLDGAQRGGMHMWGGGIKEGVCPSGTRVGSRAPPPDLDLNLHLAARPLWWLGLPYLRSRHNDRASLGPGELRGGGLPGCL